MVITVLSLIGRGNSAYSQSTEEKVDSLITVLISLEKSKQKVLVLNKISVLVAPEDHEMGLSYAEQALSIAEDLDDKYGILLSSQNLGRIYAHYYLDFFEAKHHLSRAVELVEETSNDKLKLSVYRDYAFLMNEMGSCNYSINYYRKAIAIGENLEDYDQLATLYSYIADSYMDCGDKKNAVDHYSLCYALYTSGRLVEITPAVHIAAARYLRLTGDFDEAIRIYKKSASEFESSEQYRFASYTYSQLAQAEILNGDYYNALEAAAKGMEIAEDYGLLKEKLDNYEVQIAIYDSLGDYKKTYVNLIRYTKLKDSISSSQFMEQNRKFQSNYEEMMNENHVTQLKEAQKNQELEIENQRLNRNIIIGILVFVVIIVILMILRLRYIRNKEREMSVLTLATSHTTNSIILFDKNVCVEWVNKGFERLTGLSLEQVKGQYFLDFYNGPELDPRHVSELKANYDKGDAFTMDLSSFNRITKEKYWIAISVTPLYQNNEVRGYVSVATEVTKIKNTQKELELVHERTKLLNEIGRQLTSTLSVSEIIEKVYSNVNELMEADNLGIGIYKELDQQLFFPEPIEKGKKLKSFGYDISNKERIAVKCFVENSEIMVGSLDEILALTGANPSPVAGEQPKSIIYVPLVSKWKTIGVLSVQSFKEKAFGLEELEMVRTLAIHIAIAIENAGLYENMEEKVRERTIEVTKQKELLQVNYENIKLLSELGVQISSSLEFEDIFESLHESVSELMDAEIFGVRLYHKDRNVIEYKYEFESGERDPIIEVSMDDKDNYSVWCVENKKEIFINDNHTEYSKYVKEVKVPSGEMPSSLIFYPMIADGDVLGVITVQSFKKKAYNKYHVAMVKTLASYTSSALKNAELYDTLEQKVEERTKELAQKNKDIMSSINYAKRIQNGILPSEIFMNQLLPESFVFYRPRDIISGDFYWVERSAGKVFFAVVDCTGHGVPGALMSIIGKNILDQAVNEKEIDDPSMILTFLRAGLRVAFGADEGENGSEVEDGMDLAVCVWDTDERTVSFAGANSNLYLVHDGALEVMKGDKSGVSASNFDMKNYTTHEVEILKGDTIYLSSDGFPDQFGGERMKKYSQRRFQEFLLGLASLPINLQEDKINQEFSDWKGDLDQLDDICVMGVKF
jgi:PAS domain S-box-containing protein